MEISKRTWRKIALGAAIGLIAALIIMIVAMACIPVYFFPKVNEKQNGVFDFTNVQDFRVRQQSKDIIGLSGNPADNDELSTILKTWRSSFSATFLTASTNGATGSGKNFKLEDAKQGFGSRNVSEIVTNYAYSIELRFSSVAYRTLYHANGEIAYKNDQRNDKGEITNPQSLEQWKVYGVVICIPEGGGLDRMDIYFITEEQAVDNPRINVVMRVYANYGKLYKLLNEIASEDGRIAP